MDTEQIAWARKFVDRKELEDANRIAHLFMVHHCKLLDEIVRKNYKKLCRKCRGDGKKHICEGLTSLIVDECGGEILDHATKEEIQKTWSDFVNETEKRDYFKRSVFKWLRCFYGTKQTIHNCRDFYAVWMERHFPNLTTCPTQLYLDYDDRDEID